METQEMHLLPSFIMSYKSDVTRCRPSTLFISTTIMATANIKHAPTSHLRSTDMDIPYWTQYKKIHWKRDSKTITTKVHNKMRHVSSVILRR